MMHPEKTGDFKIKLIKHKTEFLTDNILYIIKKYKILWLFVKFVIGNLRIENV